METNPYQSPQHVVESVAQPDDALDAAAKRRLRTPALLAIGLALLNALIDVATMSNAIFYALSRRDEYHWMMAFFGALMLLGLHFLEAFCIWNLLTLRSRAWAEFGAILVAMPVCSPFYVVGLPVGWWLVHLLGEPEIKQAFKRASGNDAPVDGVRVFDRDQDGED